jgi:adenosylcobinamide-phosphate synthase
LIILPILVVILALVIDFAFGDPRNKYHPTVWVGKSISKIIPIVKSTNPKSEKIGGVALVISVTLLVSGLIIIFDSELKYFNSLQLAGISKILVFIMAVACVGLLLKTTIAVKTMEQHSYKIMKSLSKNDLDVARERLSMIVKRNTSNLDRQHVVSATLESISENTVDGITGPLFYFAIFGLVGAFIYRTINTIDSMIGYKTNLFKNLGWFGANCDKVLNIVPSRLTSLVMILASMVVGGDWRHSLQIMRRDGPNTESPNAGYPMAAIAGALGVRFEKLDHYTLGDGNSEITEKHFRTAIAIMKLTTILFAMLFTIPMIVVLSYLGWWTFV